MGLWAATAPQGRQQGRQRAQHLGEQRDPGGRGPGDALTDTGSGSNLLLAGPGNTTLTAGAGGDTMVGGNLQLVLADNAHVTFVGVTSLGSGFLA